MAGWALCVKVTPSAAARLKGAQLSSSYSWRREITGSMRDARRAGM